jgi:DNA excision repair protein ERCC-4
MLLYVSGLHIVPATITVGDYILSPDICVERKGISDLFQSFASGRLYTQVEHMIRCVTKNVFLSKNN